MTQHSPEDLFYYPGPGWKSRTAWRDARDDYTQGKPPGARHDLIAPGRLAIYSKRLARLRAAVGR